MKRRSSMVVSAACGWVVALHAVQASGAQNPVGCTAANLRDSGRPNPVASYRIFATLDVERHTVKATETIEWHNPSNSPTNELFFHAYLNAFSHERTRFLRAPDAGRSITSSGAAPGHLSITRLVASEHPDQDLLPAMVLHSPNDPNDATDLRVALPFEVPGRATLSLEVEFESVLPTLTDRAGFSRTFHAIAQWFPKLARRDSDGTWRHFAYEACAEFSSDFGDYDITLDVPDTYVIAAPGIPLTLEAAPGRRKERYCLAAVHDFAWFAWDRFVTSQTTFGATQVRLYSSPDQRGNVESTLDTVRWGFDYYSDRYLPYPYTSLTVVHPPDHAAAAGAMEYPQLITIGGAWYYRHLGSRIGQSIVLHELAHQWFYGIIASDEYRAPLLDEGLTSWAESEAVSAKFGAGSLFDWRWAQGSEAASRRSRARRASRRGPLARPAVEFADFSAIADAIYARFPTLLETIARVFPEADLTRAVRAYAEQFRFGHPEPADFVSAIRPYLPEQAVNAISTALFSDGWVDFAVRRISSEALPGTAHYVNRILVERRGTLDLPVLLEIEFDNGQVARRRLENVGTATWVEWDYASPAIAATVDPDSLITIDDDLENQTLRVRAKPPLPRLAAALHAVLSLIWSLGWP